MGLTIHYSWKFSGALKPGPAEALVRTLHRRAAALVRRNKLARINPVQPVDPAHPSACQLVIEKQDEHNSLYHDVPPKCGWMFTVHPGEGCESAAFGLALYPARIRAGRRSLATGCSGWAWSDFCKTQYASRHGTEHFLKCHRAVVDLVLLWEQAGATVRINDEGGYWPGRDEKRLLAEVGGMNRLIAGFAGALKDATGESGNRIQAPIFAHPQFEHLEAEGATELGDRLPAAVGLVSRLTQDGHMQPEC